MTRCAKAATRHCLGAVELDDVRAIGPIDGIAISDYQEVFGMEPTLARADEGDEFEASLKVPVVGAERKDPPLDGEAVVGAQRSGGDVDRVLWA